MRGDASREVAGVLGGGEEFIKLGRNSAAFALDTYAHVMPGMQPEAAELLMELILGPEPDSAGEKLERIALEEAIRTGAGLLKDEDYPHWRDTASVQEWVRAS